jgi:ribosomal protein S21
MAIKVDKNQGENFGRLMRRFNNAVQRSQILTVAKKNRHREKKATKREQKEKTLRQMRIEKEQCGY